MSGSWLDGIRGSLRSAFVLTRSDTTSSEEASVWPRVLLLLVIVLALLPRLVRAHAGLPYIHTWDEPQTADTALRILKTGDLNPHFFTYGSLIFYLYALVDILHYFYLMAQPETAPVYLTHLNDIQTHYETGWLWTVSHPSFYLWNRYFMAAVGAMTAALTYLLARRFGGRAAGLLAAGLLAGLALHVKQSALLTPDVLVAFLITASAVLSLLFIERGKPLYLVLSLSAAGFACSTKYNAIIALAIPVLAFAYVAAKRGPGYRPWLWVALALVPAATFLAGTPYALLDLSTFLEYAGKELRVYTIHGSVGNPIDRVNPGMGHLLVQIKNLASNLGVVSSVLAVAGLAIILSRAIGWILIAFPVVYLIFMSGTHVPFQRNFIALYPFAAAAFGAGAVLLYRWISCLAAPRRAVRRAVHVLPPLAMLGLLAYQYTTTATDAWAAGTLRETRSVVVDRVNEISGGAWSEGQPVGLAEELRIHPRDLARLSVPYRVQPFLDLVCELPGYALVVFSPDHRAYQPSHEPVAEVLDAVALEEHTEILETIPGEPISLDALSINPALRIARPNASAGDPGGPCVGASGPSGLTGTRPYPTDEDGRLVMHSAGTVSSPAFLLPPGSYAFAWRASGTRARGESAKLRASVGLAFETGDEPSVHTDTFELKRRTMDYVLPFTTTQDAVARLDLEFINDYWDEKTGRDRNVYLGAVRLLRLPDTDVAATEGG